MAEAKTTDRLPLFATVLGWFGLVMGTGWLVAQGWRLARGGRYVVPPSGGPSSSVLRAGMPARRRSSSRFGFRTPIGILLSTSPAQRIRAL
ncbi:MAG: hypothetical protein ACODAJ_14185 [Planctomycetota bacterium]